MHNEFPIHKVKGVGFGLKRLGNHLPHSFRVQFGEIVNMLHSVFAVRNTKSKVKVERLEKFVAKEMPFNHTKFLDCLRTH